MQIHLTEIGFDIDGVVADTCKAFLLIAGKKYGFTGISPAEITDFDVTKCLDVPPDIVEEIFDFLIRDPISACLQPLPYAVHVLTRMAKVGPIHFITARPYKQPILDWLEDILPPLAFRQARLTATGDHDDKIKYIKEQRLRFFVDDRAKTCLDIKKTGITPIVFNQPWNIGKHRLQTVDSWHCIEKNLIF